MTSLLDRVVDFYLKSDDFNGYIFDEEDHDAQPEAADLVRSGLVEVMSGKEFPNPHIRPWPARRSFEEQVQDLATAAEGGGSVCLYPTAEALTGRLEPQLYADQPYRRRVAEGRGRLEPAFFRLDVLEFYRNDPRYQFTFHDVGVYIAINDDAYLDKEEPEEDKTSIPHVGFAYDLSTFDPDDPDAPMTRRVCAFLGDLGNLTPTHQQRWRTFEVPEAVGLEPHPMWMAQQMGQLPDGLGPFETFMFELRNWNELHRRAVGVDLLGTTVRPREFGWILRPSQAEFDAFIVQLDKLLSDNLRHEAFTEAGVSRRDEQGQLIGTLNRLKRLLVSDGVPEDMVRSWLRPLHDVREARQEPAHTIRANVTDRTAFRRQVELLEAVTASLFMLRYHWQRHPANKDWSPPAHMATAKRYRL